MATLPKALQAHRRKETRLKLYRLYRKLGGFGSPGPPIKTSQLARIMGWRTDSVRLWLKRKGAGVKIFGQWKTTLAILAQALSLEVGYAMFEIATDGKLLALDEIEKAPVKPKHKPRQVQIGEVHNEYRIVALRDGGKRDYHKGRAFDALCSCGKTFIVYENMIRRKDGRATKSCGHLVREAWAEIWKIRYGRFRTKTDPGLNRVEPG